MKKIISTLLIYFIPLINLIYGQEACSVSSQNIDLSYFDLSLEGNQPDYQIKMYFNIIRTDDTDGDGEGEGGYDPTRIPILISIIDEAYNQYGIFFNYVCENNYIDSDERIENGFSDAGMCTGWDEFLHGDGIDIFIIAGFPTGIAGSGGVANGIPGTFIVLRGRGGTDGNSVFENSTIVHELGHLFGLLHMFHGCTQNPLIWNTGECQENPNGYGCGGESLCPWSELDYSCEGGSIPDLNECAEYYVNENDNNGDIAGDYIPDTPPSHNLIEKHRPNIDCTHSDKDVYNYADGKPTSALIVDPKGNDYNPDYNNFMSYNPYKDCRDHFTPNQVTVMKNYLESNPILQSVKTSETEVCECTYDHVINVNGTMTISDLISSYNLDQEVLVNSQIIIDGTLIVDKNFTFSGTLFSMKYKSVIEIKKGKVVCFDNVDIMDCGKFWKEIKVESGSTLNISGNSYIENGLAAVNAQKGATIDIDHTTFNNNRIGLYLNSLGEGKRTDVSIANTTFTSDENYTSPSDEGPRPVCGIYVKGQSRVYLRTTESNKNYFSTLQNGILAEKSSIKVSYSEFDDIKSVGYDNNKLLDRKGYAVKILDGKGISSVNHNVITDSRYGIGAEKGVIIAFENEISVNEQGILASDVKRIRANYNSIDAPDVGVYLVGSDNQFNQIINNYVTITSDNPAAKAIDAQSSGKVNIDNNYIIVNNNDGGIFLNDCTNSSIENNTIEVYGAEGEITDGIHIAGSFDIEVIDNYIEDDNMGGTDNNGIYVDNSDNSTYSCNYSIGFEHGMQFWNSCDGSTLEGNDFDINQWDLALGSDQNLGSGSTVIGVQGDEATGNGNVWNNGGRAHNSSTQQLIEYSKFYVNSSDDSRYKPEEIEAVSNDWFHDESGIVNQAPCSGDPGTTLPPKENCKDIIKKIMKIDTLRGFDECRKAMWIYKYYKKLLILKKKGLLSKECEEFLRKKKDDEKVSLGEVAMDMDSIAGMMPATQESLNDLIGLNEQLEQLYEAGDYGTDIWREKMELYDQKKSLYNNLLDEERYLDMISVNNLKGVLEGVSVSDSCMRVLKKVYKAKLNMMESDTLASEDRIYLLEVVENCPKDMGESVFVARSMLSRYETKRYSRTDDCIMDELEQRSDWSKPLQETISIFPNPAFNEVRVNINLTKNESGVVKVLDIHGEMMEEYEIEKGNTELLIKTNSFKSGMYFVKFESGKGNVSIKKLLIAN